MSTFDLQMNGYQVKWRKSNVKTREWGWQRGVQRAWILPRESWKEGLWPGIREGAQNPLVKYLEESGMRQHSGAHNLKSSWTLCANLYFPFRASRDGRALLASFLRQHVAGEIASLECIELEYEGGGLLHPSHLLGERDGTRGARQTSPDLGLLVNNGRGLVLVENKFVEKSFYGCRGFKHKDNPDPSRCERPKEVVNAPSEHCHVAQAWGRKYWDHLAPIADMNVLADLTRCPAARGRYQLFRQHALAEGIAQSGAHELVVSAVALDERNDILKRALRPGGVTGVGDWRKLFRGKAKFAVFTHQAWVRWVAEHDSSGQWGDWLSWVKDRYDL